MKYVKNPENNKCFFTVTKTGDPIKIQRSIFSECFYMIAMAELARATGEAKYKVTLTEMLKKDIVSGVMKIHYSVSSDYSLP